MEDLTGVCYRVQSADGQTTMLTTTMLGNNDGVCNSMPGWNPLDIWSVRVLLLLYSLQVLEGP